MHSEEICRNCRERELLPRVKPPRVDFLKNSVLRGTYCLRYGQNRAGAAVLKGVCLAARTSGTEGVRIGVRVGLAALCLLMIASPAALAQRVPIPSTAEPG